MAHNVGERAATSPAKPKLLDQLRRALRSRHHSRRAERTYSQWVRRYIFSHNVRHPAEMGEAETNAPGASWAQGHSDHDDLYPRPEPWREGVKSPLDG